MNHNTTLEQSKRLLELGLKPEKSDGWSVGELFDLLPSIISDGNKDFAFELIKDEDDDEPFYILRYYNIENWDNAVVHIEENTLVTALYRMVLWLFETRHL